MNPPKDIRIVTVDQGAGRTMSAQIIHMSEPPVSEAAMEELRKALAAASTPERRILVIAESTPRSAEEEAMRRLRERLHSGTLTIPPITFEPRTGRTAAENAIIEALSRVPSADAFRDAMAADLAREQAADLERMLTELPASDPTPTYRAPTLAESFGRSRRTRR